MITTLQEEICDRIAEMFTLSGIALPLKTKSKKTRERQQRAIAHVAARMAKGDLVICRRTSRPGGHHTFDYTYHAAE